MPVDDNASGHGDPSFVARPKTNVRVENGARLNAQHTYACSALYSDAVHMHGQKKGVYDTTHAHAHYMWKHCRCTGKKYVYDTCTHADIPLLSAVPAAATGTAATATANCRHEHARVDIPGFFLVAVEAAAAAAAAPS